MNQLPNKLNKLRKHYNYSQSRLAEVLGVDTITYMGYENGRAIPNYQQCKKLASFYHISVEEIFSNKEDVHLYEVNAAKTDELNIEYFIPKPTFLGKIRHHLKHHKKMMALLGALSVICILLLVFLLNGTTKRPYVPVLENRNRLSVSQTSVVYIDNNGAVRASGDNSNSQLSNLPSSSAIKVSEGSTYTIILKDDGTLESQGLLSRYADKISDWHDIVDVSCGNSHVIALDNLGRVLTVGDNSNGQCDVDDWDDISKVYAFKEASIGLSSTGKVYYAGDIMGSSRLKNYNNLLDLDCSENNLIFLKEDGTVDYFSRYKDFLSVNTWRNITAVAAGDEFLAGLKSDGTVVIAIDNYLIKEEVSSWHDIIAISAGDDYLIGFDGEKIYGVGDNSYHQFESSAILKQTLPQVKNVRVEYDRQEVRVQFEGVENAESYLVSLQEGIGQSFRCLADQNIIFDASGLKDGMTYTISIVSLGQGDYEDSQPLYVDFIYHIEEEKKDDSVDIVEVPFTIDSLIGKTKTNFEAYLNGLGVSDMQGSPSKNPCSGDEALIESVEGIKEHESITHSELLKRQIRYTYCKIEKNDEK